MRGASREAQAAGWKALEALLDGATPGAGVDAASVADDLFAACDLLDSEVALRRALSDPSAAAERKVALLDAVTGERLGTPALGVLRDLVRQRWSQSRDLADVTETLGVLAVVIGAQAAGRLDDVEDELFRFGRVIESDASLHVALADRGLPTGRKRSVVEALLSGKAAPETVRLVDRAVTAPRGHSVEAALAEYGRIAAQRRERLVAFARVAVPLDDAQHDRLARALAATYGRDVWLNVEVDPDVVGGVVVRVGDEVIDGSIAGRLAEASRQFES